MYLDEVSWDLSPVCLVTCEGVGADAKLDGSRDVRKTWGEEEFNLSE